MLALAVIGVYFLLAGWMMSMDALHAVGKRTGAWDLEKMPFVSAFLSERMLAESGPPGLAGLGRPIGTVGRLDSVDFFFSRVRSATDGIRELEEESGRTMQDVIDGFAVQERRIIDVSEAELLSRVAEGESILRRLDDSRSLANSAETVVVQVGTAKSRLATLKRGSEDADIAILREEVAFSIEEILFAVDDYQLVAGVNDTFPIETINRLRDSAEVFFNPDGETPELEAAFEELLAAAKIEMDVQANDVARLLPESEAFIDRLMPIPDGIDGLSYKSRLLLGTDRQGRSILIRSLYSAKIAIQVGVVVGLTAVLIGSLLGAVAAFFGGWVDHAIIWLYSTFSSIPQLVLLAVLSFVFLSEPFRSLRGLPSLYMAFALTYWTGPCRVIRGEVMKIKELEYVHAATAIGHGRFYILIRHIMPNTTHLMFINFSLLFIGAIKGEVILTFLGLGLPLGDGASWGIMISQAKSEVVLGFFWQIGAATLFMFILVLAFNILSDALQDAFDPRHVG